MSWGRRLTEGEMALARSVFGEAIALERVRIAVGGFFGAAVTIGPVISFPFGAADDFARAEPRMRAWLIHELTHVWQWSVAPARTALSWAKAAATGGYGPGLRAYRYTLPLGRFADYGLEQQAAIVEHAYLLLEGGPSAGAPIGARWADYAGEVPFPSAHPHDRVASRESG